MGFPSVDVRICITQLFTSDQKSSFQAPLCSQLELWSSEERRNLWVVKVRWQANLTSWIIRSSGLDDLIHERGGGFFSSFCFTLKQDQKQESSNDLRLNNNLPKCPRPAMKWMNFKDSKNPLPLSPVKLGLSRRWNTSRNKQTNTQRD